MRRIARISALLTAFFGLPALVVLLGGCASGPLVIPDHRPGDFRLGVVVMVPEVPGQTEVRTDDRPDDRSISIDGRYIVESSSVLRASFGAGSTLDTYPGFTRRLNSGQMDALWFMARKLLESRLEDPSFGTIESHPTLHAGQPQDMVSTVAGSIIEIHMNAHDEVLLFSSSDDRPESIINAMADLAWIETESD